MTALRIAYRDKILNEWECDRCGQRGFPQAEGWYLLRGPFNNTPETSPDKHYCSSECAS